MGTSKKFQDEAEKQKSRPAFVYLKCPGKWREDPYGGRHKVCSGPLYTNKSGIGSYCPICGTRLRVVQTEEPQKNAITCAMDRCAWCAHRDKSWAVANGCVGGDKYENRAHIVVYGTDSCRGCLCKECCEGLQRAVADFQGTGPDYYLGTRKKILGAVEGAAAGGSVTLDGVKAAVDAVKADPASGRLSPGTIEWEALGAVAKLRRAGIAVSEE
jgi:hypothetical protein